MSRTIRQLSVLVVVALVLSLAPRAQAQPRPLGKVTLGLSVAKTFEFLPAHAAEDLGTWKKRGLEVTIVAFPGDARLQQAFAAGAVEFGLGSATGGLSAIAKGLDTRLVGAISNSVALMGLVAAPEIKSREDLRGKTIGATSPNALTDVLVKYLSKKLTGDPERGIRRAHLGGFQNQVAALKTGQTQAFVWTLEGIFEVEKQGVGKFLLSFGDEFPDFTFEVIIARKHLIEEKPEVVRALLEGWYEAQAHMKANKEYTVDLFERKMETPKDIGARVWDFDAKTFVDDGLFSDAALRAAAQSLVDTQVIKEIPPLDQWVDRRFLPVRWKK
ncbi:MAG: ABC transporter substrate-binding protein [Candidatus Rokubacteria bacterium]|nr:ABC transporter substrate-binding protein [Candidatus Rokubacteria bacterium]